IGYRLIEVRRDRFADLSCSRHCGHNGDSSASDANEGSDIHHTRSPLLHLRPRRRDAAQLNSRRLMSAMLESFGLAKTSISGRGSRCDICCTTALAPKADVHPRSWYVREEPWADTCSSVKLKPYLITSPATVTTVRPPSPPSS